MKTIRLQKGERNRKADGRPWLLAAMALCTALMLVGCESSRVRDDELGGKVDPRLALIPAEQASFYVSSGTATSDKRVASALTTDAVEIAPPISAIQINRFQDPGDPNLLHEAHVIYRRDTAPRWKLQPSSAGQQILVGPQITDGRGEIQPLASPELEAYLREQRAFLAKQQQVIVSVNEALSSLENEQRQLALEIAKNAPKRTAETSPSETASAISPGDAPAKGEIFPVP